MLGRLSHEVGWKYRDIVARLEEKRKQKGKLFHKKRLREKKIRRIAEEKIKDQLTQVNQGLHKLGHAQLP